jgi:hypothetical protein
MLKKRIIAVVAALALLLAAVGSTGIVTDWLGQSTTTPAFACPAAGGSGGGC